MMWTLYSGEEKPWDIYRGRKRVMEVYERSSSDSVVGGAE